MGKAEPLGSRTGTADKTPREKGNQVGDLTGVKTFMTTPKQRCESTENLTGVIKLKKNSKVHPGTITYSNSRF